MSNYFTPTPISFDCPTCDYEDSLDPEFHGLEVLA